LMTPVTKYWVCKIAPALGAEAMECLGGNGYVEEGLAARLYREMPLNAIWEGSGNVMALDVLRVLQRDGDVIDHVLDELEALAKGDQGLAMGLGRVRGLLADPRRLDTNARSLLEALALAASGVLLRAHAPSAVADAFIASRLGGSFRQTYGAGIAGTDTAAILKRVLPVA
jgi:putative acyl-CoA dehydrogenase